MVHCIYFQHAILSTDFRGAIYSKGAANLLLRKGLDSGFPFELIIVTLLGIA